MNSLEAKDTDMIDESASGIFDAVITDPFTYIATLVFIAAAMVMRYYFRHRNNPLDASSTATTPADSELRRMHFAGYTLIGLGLILVLAMGMYFSAYKAGEDAGAGKEIFASVFQAVVPLVTLIIGFFFGKSTSTPDINPAPQPQQAAPPLPPAPPEKPAGA